MNGMSMQGIDILNKTMVTDTCGWAFIIVIIGAIVLIVSFITFIIFAASECFGIANVCFWVLITSIFAVLLVAMINPQTETGRYRYEVTIDDSVSFLDLHEKYDVIEQNGRIWTLEDREAE